MVRRLIWCRRLAFVGIMHIAGFRAGFATATDYLVTSAADIASKLSQVHPGDTLVMGNGTWTNQRIQFAAIGTAAAPITLRAQTPGEVVLNGNSKINISGSYLTGDGLRFDGGALASNDHIVEFRGSKGNATYSRLTNSAIIDYNPASIDTRYFWVSLYGQHNRVDHNMFEGQNHSGVTVVVWRPNGAPDYHEIDSNYFLDRPVPVNPAETNGFETIRIGDSSQSLSNSYTTVEGNLFERLDSEIEIVSNKSSSNIFRDNTFRDSAGTLTLRHGNDNLVEGNFFLGDNKSQTGGIRIIGERQTVVNNYIANVDDRAGGAISISAGVPDSELNQYYQVKDAVIAHNTVIDTTGVSLTFDDGFGSSGRTLLAQNVTVADNLFKDAGPTIFEGNQGTGWTWQGNVAFGGGLGPAAGNPGVAVANPQLALGPNGIWRPAAGSPVINAGVGDYSALVPLDMDGQPRTAPLDIGADEASTAPIIHGPLTAADVGPAWFRAQYAAADFNGAGGVNGTDLALWRGGFGGAGGKGQGNANGDGVVDGADWLLWQQQFSAAGVTTATAATVPEPTVFSLIGALAIVFLSVPVHGRRDRLISQAT